MAGGGRVLPPAGGRCVRRGALRPGPGRLLSVAPRPTRAAAAPIKGRPPPVLGTAASPLAAAAPCEFGSGPAPPTLPLVGAVG